jgi:hypothetical protein
VTDDELKAAVDAVMDAEEDRALCDAGMVLMGSVSQLVDRAEAIAALRADRGRRLSVRVRAGLYELQGRLLELQRTLGGAR